MLVNKESQPLYNKAYDLENCDKEPLRFIRRLQAYATLVVADHDLKNWHFATEDIIPHLLDNGLSGISANGDLSLL